MPAHADNRPRGGRVSPSERLAEDRGPRAQWRGHSAARGEALAGTQRLRRPKPSAPLVDPEWQSTPGGERDGGIDARRFVTHVLGVEATEQNGEREHVFDLAHGAAN